MLGSINLVVTVMNFKAPGLKYHLLNLYVWSIIITAVLLILALPVLAGNLILPALNLAICWKDLLLGLSAGNLILFYKLGILREYTPKLIFHKNYLHIYSNSQLGYYLAGLIEGDGTIYVPKTERNSKNQLLYPSIQIVFHLKDLPLALRVQQILNCGSINRKKGTNAYILTINNKQGILLLIKLINGKMRTSKINKLNSLIDWVNKYYDSNFSYSQ